MNDVDLNALAQFAIVARHRNFRRAAAELGVSPSTLSDRIRTLEDAIGGRLLNRSTRSVALTELGERLLARTGDALAVLRSEARNLGTGIAEEGVTGRLRINGPAPAIEYRLMPVVPSFLERHPRVDLDLVAEGELVDIVGAGFDAGVRYDEKLAPDMIAVRLGPPQRMVIVGSPSYLAAHGTPAGPEDLASHACIGVAVRTGVTLAWVLSRDGRMHDFVPRGSLTVNTAEIALLAARGSVGLAFLFEEQIAQDLRSGRLKTVLEDWTPPFAGPSLYFFERRLMPPALRAFVDHVRGFDWTEAAMT